MWCLCFSRPVVDCYIIFQNIYPSGKINYKATESLHINYIFIFLAKNDAERFWIYPALDKHIYWSQLTRNSGLLVKISSIHIFTFLWRTKRARVIWMNFFTTVDEVLLTLFPLIYTMSGTNITSSALISLEVIGGFWSKPAYTMHIKYLFNRRPNIPYRTYTILATS